MKCQVTTCTSGTPICRICEQSMGIDEVRECPGYETGPSQEIIKEPVGDALSGLISEVNMVLPADCNCASRISQMNQWGVEGCKENRSQIIGWLSEDAKKIDHAEAAKQLPALITQPWFKIVDPFGSFVDEAIKRAKKNAGG